MKKIGLAILVLSVALAGACGKSKQGEEKTGAEKTAVSIPATPVGISTVSGDGQVAIRWTASSGAESYSIFVSPEKGTPEKALKIPGIKTPSYEHKGLANNTVYYYRVSAVNSAGESAISGETGAMPKATPPSAPTGVAAMGGNGKVSVKWVPVEGALSYTVYYSTKPQAERSKRTKVAGVKASPYDLTTVKKKTMYFFVVSAVNGAGESPLSAESGAMP